LYWSLFRVLMELLKVVDVEVDPFCIVIDTEDSEELSRSEFLYYCGKCRQNLRTPDGNAVAESWELVDWLRAHEGCDFSRGEPFDWGETAE
jgi:hypothetical protein